MNLLEVSLEKLIEILGTDLQIGLTGEQVSRIRKDFGKNVIFEKKNSALDLLKKMFGDVMMILFLLMGIFDYLETGDRSSFFAVISVIFVYGSFVIGTHFYVSYANRKISKFSQSKYHVKRSDRIVSVAKSELVPGDLLLLEKGDVVPCDGIILRHNSLTILEAGVTGRRVPVAKKSHNEVLEGEHPYFESILFAGSVVLQGNVKMYVCNTGKNIFDVNNQTVERHNTSLPKIYTTALELKKQISMIWVVVSLFLFAWSVFCGANVFDSFYFISAMVIAAFPDSIEHLCDVALARMTLKLFAGGVVLRNPGAVDRLCDANRIFVYSGDYLFHSLPIANSYYLGQEWYDFSRNREKSKVLLENLLLAQNDRSYFRGRRDELNVDRALQAAAASVGIQKTKLSKSFLSVNHYDFDPVYGYSCSLVMKDGKYRLVIRGNPNSVLAACGEVFAGERNIPVSESVRSALREQIRHLSGLCERVVAVAVLNVSSPSTGDQRTLCRGMTYMGAFGLSTPVSASAANAINSCRKAGVQTHLLVDDFSETVTALAKSVSIIGDNDYPYALPYATYGRMDRGVFISEIEKYKAFSGFPVEEKQNIVRYHKDKGNITVSMTGGVLDTLPQMEADISFVGVDEKLNAVRLNADLLVSEKRFDLVPFSMNWSRLFYRNIVHIMQYILLLQTALAFSVFAGFTIFGMEPFDKLQMLLMGIFVFIPTAINLLFHSPDPYLVDNEYVLKNERVFSLRSLLLAPMSVGAIQALVVMISRQIALNATKNVWSAASSAIVTFVFSAFFASLSLKFDKPLFKVVKKDVKSSLVTFLICVCTALLLTLSPLKEFWQGSERWAFAGFLPLVISIALSFAPACALEVLKLIKKDDSAKRRDS